jgi:hypothetical protein
MEIVAIGKLYVIEWGERIEKLESFFPDALDFFNIMNYNDIKTILWNPQMLEMALLVGTPPKEIILQTRVGHSVPNSQSCEPDADSRDFYDRIRETHAWVHRKPACGVYNCFGLVWANRRTAIYEEHSISQILDEDGYRKLRIDEQPLPGDIVIYLRFSDQVRNTYHAGVIMELVEQRIGGRVPWVLSKWGGALGEDMHEIRDVPPLFSGCAIEIWTDRP